MNLAAFGPVHEKRAVAFHPVLFKEIELRLRLGQGYAVAKPGDRRHHIDRDVGGFKTRIGVDAGRYIEIGLSCRVGKDEVRGQNSHHGLGFSGERDGVADDCRDRYSTCSARGDG